VGVGRIKPTLGLECPDFGPYPFVGRKDAWMYLVNPVFRAIPNRLDTFRKMRCGSKLTKNTP